MKRLFLSLTLITLLAPNLTAQNYGLDNTNPAVFSKFSVPETKLSSLWFNTNFSFNANKNSSSYPYSPDNYSTYDSRTSYSLSPRYYFLNENDYEVISLNIDINGRYNRNYREQDDEYEGKLNAYELNLNINGNYKKYFLHNNIFYSLTSKAFVNIEERKEDYPSNDVHNDYTGQKAQNYILSFGIGWGKMRHITPVISAIRFQERLKQLNLLNTNLSDEVIVKLAEQFYRAGYYSSIYDRPEKYFWNDIEKVLNEDGISLDGVNQYGSSYLREIPNEIRFSRREGFILGVNLQLQYNNSYYSETSFPIFEQLNILGNAYAQYSHQLNLNSQIYSTLSISGGPSVIEDAAYKQLYYLNATVGYDYELTDRIVTSIYNSFRLEFFNYGAQSRYLYNNLNLNVNYFIEDNLSLDSTFSWNYHESRYPNQMRYTSNNNNIQLGFTYYIDRGFLHR